MFPSCFVPTDIAGRVHLNISLFSQRDCSYIAGRVHLNISLFSQRDCLYIAGRVHLNICFFLKGTVYISQDEYI